VPGYAAPAGQTTAPGTRVIGALIRVLAELAQECATAPTPIPASLSADFVSIRAEFGVEISDHVIARGILIWAALFGAVSFDVFDQYGRDTFGSRDELFELHLDGLLTLL